MCYCPPLPYELISDEIEKEFMQHGFPHLEIPENNTSVVLGSSNFFTEGQIQSPLVSPGSSPVVMTDFGTDL